MNPTETVARLKRDGLKLGVAESCTGGLLGGSLTDVPGASKVFVGGVIAYDNIIKTSVLGVDETLFKDGHGAVSAAVAEKMADGLRDAWPIDVALAVTGIAGPDGGTDGKPVGTVWIACVGPGDLVNVHRVQAKGTRQDIRAKAVQAALDLLARNLEEVELAQGS